MGGGLIQAGPIRLTAWAPDGHRRAMCAQRPVRRLPRGLEPTRRDGHARYGPLMQHAIPAWGDQRVYLALATSRFWKTYCLVRLALVSRGRAIPLVWTVRDHPSRRVASHVDLELLDQGA